MRKRDFYNFLDFAEKLQPEENIAPLIRWKRREKDEEKA